MMHDKDVVRWHSRVPPGVPGAGWLVGIVFAFSVIVLGSWWLQGSHISTAAPTHSMSNAHN
jgi:hypothetical protein